MPQPIAQARYLSFDPRPNTSPVLLILSHKYPQHVCMVAVLTVAALVPGCLLPDWMLSRESLSSALRD